MGDFFKLKLWFLFVMVIAISFGNDYIATLCIKL